MEFVAAFTENSLGIYVSVPFCRAKCSFCNFASDAFSPARMQGYVERLVGEMAAARLYARQHGLRVPGSVDSVFFGGGTPSLLSPVQMFQVFQKLRAEFEIAFDAEITVEAAPGQLSEELLQTLLEQGVNRISLGVQSFVDGESRAVGRLHTGEQCLREIERLRSAGLRNLNVDLIAGLPHQTAESWQRSLEEAIGSGVEHVSTYMLEVDEDSRLGREVGSLRAASQLTVLQQEARYSAAAVPSEDACAELYAQGCAVLEAAGLRQYEISNFAREGFGSRHNRKYWERKPYLGFGLDAHSMLEPLESSPKMCAVRFANTDDLERYVEGEEQGGPETVDALAAFEEAVFLGLRLNSGLDFCALEREHGAEQVRMLRERARLLQREGLMQEKGNRLGLTAHGRVVSSSVFAELLAVLGTA